MWIRSAAVLLLSACVGSALVARQGTASKRKISENELQNLVQAVEDEIYDYGFENDYYQMGENLGTPSHWVSRMPIYIQPELTDGSGFAIYKYMHYTIEVYREFEFGKRGLAILDLSPELEFPPTQASTKTIYMNDEDVCRMKHDWLKRTFVIDTEPPFEVVKAAAHRQVLRTGFSRWQTIVLPRIQKRETQKK